MLTTNKNSKTAAKLVKRFKFNHQDFPKLVERLIKKSVRYNKYTFDW